MVGLLFWCLWQAQLLLSRAKSPYTWVAQSEKAEFGPVYAHAVLTNFKDQMFLIGGASPQGELSSDVWRSDDKGKSWKQLEPRSKRFTPRRGHAAVVDPKRVILIVMGGFSGRAKVDSDCWSSQDGYVWRSLGSAPWTARHGHAAVMTSNSWIVMLGGHDRHSYLSDVWKIHHASQPMSMTHLRAQWVRVTNNAPWTARYGHTTLVDADDVIYLLGGFFAEKETGRVQCFNDVWSSADLGQTWHLVTAHAPWPGRYQHAATITSTGEFFVLGGLSVDLERLPDVWRSQDRGVSWVEVTRASSWAARYEHAALVDANDTIYVLGGIAQGAEAFADVWLSQQTCADHVKCTGATPVCRDGTEENFEGLTRPLCVGICDRRIFDECKPKEDCRVQDDKPTCVDPCDDKECEADQVCEAAPRDEVFRGEMLKSAEAYCLSCSHAQTKASCGQLRQCAWSTGDEACEMRCSVRDESRCKGSDKCRWKDGKCSKK
ncbi:unnamed protein product [Effrenium voratum]|uniref:Uncharacterized protein n=1 Tax=Effrenium voratum TaxID=2562239 RepID=A0AA36IYW0_9DINO|nr:unnamed protein product [Effrenium voratum]CAJ1422498.1 unnamed protein product [Effrenium voratum]